MALLAGSLIMAAGVLANAVPAFIPNKERREDIDDAEQRKREGLTEEEKSQLDARMAASDAAQNKAILNTIQETKAGSGQISGADSILSQQVAQEQVAQSSQRRGQVISQAEQIVKDRAAQELAVLNAEEQQWKDNRLQTAFGLVGDATQVVGAGVAGGTNVQGKWDWGAAGKSAIAQAQQMNRPQQQIGYNPLGIQGTNMTNAQAMEGMTEAQKVKFSDLLTLFDAQTALNIMSGGQV